MSERATDFLSGRLVWSRMEKVAAADVDAVPSAASVRRPLADAVGAENVSVNYYELAPGDSFAFGYHYHGIQEELFYVLEGEATFETEEGDVTVGPGELVRFAPGDRQQGWNRGDERVVALALGAPRELGEGEILRACPECGERTPHRLSREEGAMLTICAACDTQTGRYTA